MKKITKTIFCLIMVLAVAFSVLVLPISAATIDDTNSTTMHFSPSKSKNEYNIGDTVTARVTWKTSALVYFINGSVKYDSSVLQYVSGADSNPSPGEAFIDHALSDSGENQLAFEFKFKVIANGKSNISVSLSAGDSDYNKHIGGQTGTLTALETSSTPSDTTSTPSDTSSTASNNANLASLKVSGGTLSPKFSANTTSYTVKVANDVKKTTITATTADKNATVNGAGNIKLSVGDNKRVITVTAPNGTKKTYNLNIHRLDVNEDDTTSSDTPTQDDDPTQDKPGDPYGVYIDGELYRIQTDLSSLIQPIGYTQSEIAYNGVTVPIYTDEKAKMMLYGLSKDGTDTVEFYSYDVATKQFKKVNYFQNTDRFYIFAELEENLTAPKGYFEKYVDIGENRIRAFAYENSILSEFSVVYCYADGKYGYYRYDSKEETLQRLPEFTPAISENVSASTNKTEDSGLINRFMSLSQNGKIVIIAIIIVGICIIALVIMLIVYAFGRRNDDFKEATFTTDDDYLVEDAIPFDTIKQEVNSANGEQPEDK